jgi:Polyketide cyclase / dehydrase and lipid transport
MIIEAQVPINGSKEAVWAAMTNIEQVAKIISGIEKVEIVERPTNGIIGLKWRETRMLFGKLATVEKAVMAGAENEFFSTESREGGFVFSASNLIRENEDGVLLRSRHTINPQGFTAMLKSLAMVFFKGMVKKAILQDLNDIKAAVERP